VRPPIGTCLLGLTIPPTGGDTLFANQHAALDAMPGALRKRIEGRVGIHSAKLGYAPDGLYGDADAAGDRTMTIRPSAAATATQAHPLIRRHDETGRASLYGCLGYVIGIEDMDDDAALELLLDLHAWQTREEFVFAQEWEEGMLVMWDNRCLLHRATGGYDGHDRLLHRTTIGAPPGP
jgi:taurine dioxygenase